MLSCSSRAVSYTHLDVYKSQLKDFESYFVEQVIKEMKDSMTLKSDDEDSSIDVYKRQGHVSADRKTQVNSAVIAASLCHRRLQSGHVLSLIHI